MSIGRISNAGSLRNALTNKEISWKLKGRFAEAIKSGKASEATSKVASKLDRLA